MPGLAVLLAWVLRGMTPPTVGLMYAMAEIGVVILLGYIVEGVWMVSRLERTGDDRENWLGLTVGLGLSGLAGVAASLAVAAHREAGYSNLIDIAGFWWAAMSIGLLAVLVTLQPVIVDRWSRPEA